MKLLAVAAPLAASASLAVVLAFSAHTPSSEAGATCDQSYGAFHNLAGHWDGEWDNHTYDTQGTVTVDATINADCTAQLIIEKEQGQPWTVDATYHDESGGTVIEVHNDAIFGDTTVTVTGNDFTIEGSMSYYGIKHFVATGSIPITFVFIPIEISMTFEDDSTATESVSLHRDSTPTPGVTSSPTATARQTPIESPTPTDTPGSGAFAWADSDCDGELTTRDNQALLRNVLSQPPLSQEQGCPPLGGSVSVGIAAAAGEGVDRLWGDWDCDGEITTRDNQALLRKVLNQPALSQEEGCPLLGDPVALS